MNYDIKNHLLVDAHFDLLKDVAKKRAVGLTKVIENDYLDDFKKGGFCIITASIFVENEFIPEMSLRKSIEQISALYSEIEESPDKIMLCKSYDDIITAIDSQKIGFILSFEGVEPLYNDLGLLKIFYKLGVRGLGITWSRRNLAADGSPFFNTMEGKKGGLSGFGVKLVKEAERIGMFIDISHLNDEGVDDVLSITSKPIIASHSNCRTLSPVMRNLTDNQIKAIAACGGVICINANSIIVADNDENSKLEFLANHIDYIKNLVGIDYIGFGFDFTDGFLADDNHIAFLSACNLTGGRKPFDVIKGHKHVDEILTVLANRGYNTGEIEKVGYKNYFRVMKSILKDT